MIGGQGTYTPEVIVTDATSATAKAQIAFAMNGSNAFLKNVLRLRPSSTIAWMRRRRTCP
ncbi:MAG: hypothetical protein WDM87_05975 [Terracidiphilus sp.]